MKIALIQPNLQSVNDKTDHPHAGLAYLAACALKKEHETFAIDAKFEGISNTAVIDRLRNINPRVLGITARTPDIREAEKIAAAVKTRRPDTIVMIGGAHVTGLRERVLKECPHFDIGVCGEGEMTFMELLELIRRTGGRETEYSGIDGIIFRKGTGIITTRARAPITDLDSLPFPAWDLFPNLKDISLFTSRGCPYQCIFCQRVMGNRVRSMSPRRVIREIKWAIKKFKATYFQIEDEVFGLNKQWLNETLQLINAERLHTVIKWFANSRVNVADYPMYVRMREAGCIGVGFGIESGNQKILDAIRKGFRIPHAIQALRWARDAGLRTNAFFILGHPGETKRTIRDTINLAVKLKPAVVCFGIMIPYPGTKIYDMARKGEGGYRGFHEDWEKYTKYFGRGLQVNDLDYQRLERWQKRAYLEFFIRNLRVKDLYKQFEK